MLRPVAGAAGIAQPDLLSQALCGRPDDLGADAEDWFANVLSGVVKLTKTLADGRQQIVELLFPSDFLGRPFKAGSGYVAEAATPVELCCFNRQPFEALMHEWPSLKQLFLERTLDEVEAAREWMLLLGRKSAEEKVAALILLVLRRMREPGCGAACRRQPAASICPCRAPRWPTSWACASRRSAGSSRICATQA